jgi:hypothetical protein
MNPARANADREKRFHAVAKRLQGSKALFGL